MREIVQQNLHKYGLETEIVMNCSRVYIQHKYTNFIKL